MRLSRVHFNHHKLVKVACSWNSAKPPRVLLAALLLLSTSC